MNREKENRYQENGKEKRELWKRGECQTTPFVRYGTGCKSGDTLFTGELRQENMPEPAGDETLVEREEALLLYRLNQAVHRSSKTF
jgi:hypothetical protein